MQDNNVPFVNTIGIVEKRGGTYSETKSSVTMPGLLGAGAEFFLDEGLVQNHHILQADSIGTDTTWRTEPGHQAAREAVGVSSRYRAGQRRSLR